MPLESLLELVETLSARIDEHGTALRQSEALTRAVLIDPLLRELGWDTEEPSLVMPEYRLGRGFADYALLKDGTPMIMVEAKKLGTPLQEATSQGIGYCIQDGIGYFAVTDGRLWEIYETHKMAPIAEKMIVQFDIAHSPPITCLKAMALWRPSVTADSMSAAQTPIVGLDGAQLSAGADLGERSATASEQATVYNTQRQAAELPAITSPPVPSSTSVQPAPILREGTNDYGEGWIALSDIVVHKGDAQPVEIQFPDGSGVPVGRWNRIIVEPVRWLTENNYLNQSHSPIRYASRYIIANTPIHPNGNGFKSSIFVGSFCIETNYSAPNCVRNARLIIQSTGQDPAQFKVRFAAQPAASSRISAPASATLSGVDADGDNWIALSDLNLKGGSTRPQLTAIQFPDKMRSQTTRWTHITFEAVRWLTENNHLDMSYCPIQHARRYIISNSPIHPTGKAFTRAVSVGDIYVEMNYSPSACIRNTLAIIERTGQDPAQFKVRLSS